MTTPTYLRASLLALKQAQPLYVLFNQLYEGTLPESFSSPVHRAALADVAKNWNINFARSVVDVPLEQMKVTGILCAEQKNRDFLDQFWSDNFMDRTSKHVHADAFKHANSYLIVGEDPELESGYSAYHHGPENVRVFYDPENPRKPTHAIHCYLAYGDGQESDVRSESVRSKDIYFHTWVYFPDVVEHWVSIYPVSDGNYNVLDLETTELKLIEELPPLVDGWIPVFDFDFERSRLADALGPQTMLRDSIVCMMASIRAAGYRQRYAIAERGNNLGDNFSDDPEDSDVETSRFVAGPDTIQLFTGSKVTVGSWDVSQSDNFIKAIEAILKYYHQVTDIPEDSLIQSAQQPSGESRRQARLPLRAVVDNSQELANPVWEKLFKFLQLASNLTPVEATIAWQPMEMDDLDYWQAATIKASLGVPRKVLIVESGKYSQDTIDQWQADNPTIWDNPSQPALPQPFIRGNSPTTR